MSVQSYELHYRRQLPEVLVKQYEVKEDHALKGLLLSPRARRTETKEHYTACTSCNNSILKGLKADSPNPPKYAIANGFVIGSIPDKLDYTNKNGESVSHPINIEEDLDDLICATISPVRPFGIVHGWSGEVNRSR